MSQKKLKDLQEQWLVLPEAERNLKIRKLIVLNTALGLVMELINDVEENPVIARHNLKTTGEIFQKNISKYLQEVWETDSKKGAVQKDLEGNIIGTVENMQKSYFGLVNILESQLNNFIDEVLGVIKTKE